MTTVKIKIHTDKLEKFLTHIQALDKNVIESINYKLPKPKVIKKTKPKSVKKPKKAKIIYKPYTFNNLVSLTDLIIQDELIVYNDTKVQVIQLIAKYNTVIKMVERMGLKSTIVSNNSYIVERTKDIATRYKMDNFKKINEVVKPINMLITRNIPLLFDYATEQKKAKGSYCLLTITQLDEPKEKEVFNNILKFIVRKTFKLYKIE